MEKNYKYHKQKINSHEKIPPPVTAVEILNLVMTLNQNSAWGTDGIGITLIYYTYKSFKDLRPYLIHDYSSQYARLHLALKYVEAKRVNQTKYEIFTGSCTALNIWTSDRKICQTARLCRNYLHDNYCTVNLHLVWNFTKNEWLEISN